MNTEAFDPPHIRQNTELRKIISQSNELSYLALDMFRKTKKYIAGGDKALRDEVVDVLEPSMNMQEDELEQRCIQFLAIEKPVVKTLRTVVMIIKMNNEFERVADLSKGIVLSAERYHKLNNKVSNQSLLSLTKLTLEILEKVIDCIVNRKGGEAHSIKSLDRDINAMRFNVVSDCLDLLRKTPDLHLATYELIVMAQKLERIGDLCKNLAEEIIYIESGDMKKH